MLESASARTLCETLSISRVTLSRQILSLRENFGVCIEFQQKKLGGPGRRGHYRIVHWGCINQDTFVANIKEVISGALAEAEVPPSHA